MLSRCSCEIPVRRVRRNALARTARRVRLLRFTSRGGMTQKFGFAYCRFWEKPWHIHPPSAAGAQSPRLGYASPSPLYTRGAHRNPRFWEKPRPPYRASIGARGKLALLREEGMPTKEAGRSKRQKRGRRCNAEAVFTYAGSPPTLCPVLSHSRCASQS